MEATDGTMLLRSADDDVARLRAILAAHPVATDDTTLIEFVQVSRRILRHASDMGWERVTAAATRIADLAQDCFPSELNFCRGANLQLHDLLVELQAHLFEVRTGNPLPGDTSTP